ncbi:ATP-binding cassette domain-containing protein [Streptomyces sp. NPDC049954]|uniref:ATP-binding cassette domain-containing protein n=1 Tax=Streptomyces sp. NPDC049954 TaxID=3155779 RepID=UPI003429E57E
MTSIDVHELTKEYGRVRAVERLDFSVRPGKVTGFLGPNGSGKSTTLRLVLGLDRPTSGTATLGGTPYHRLKDPLRHVGALLDAGAAHRSRTARDHLRVLAASNRVPERRVDEVLGLVGLGEVARRRAGSFSLGMRQRLGIGAALLGDPAVLILDEPSNGLDPEGIIWLRHLLRELADEGRTVLVSSHLMQETASYADHLVVLGRGRVLADTPLRDFVAGGTRPAVRFRSTDADRLAQALRARGHEPRSEADDGTWTAEGLPPDEVGTIAATEGIGILELSAVDGTLEQAYLELTRTETEYEGSDRASGPARQRTTAPTDQEATS